MAISCLPSCELARTVFTSIATNRRSRLTFLWIGTLIQPSFGYSLLRSPETSVFRRKICGGFKNSW